MIIQMIFDFESQIFALFDSFSLLQFSKFGNIITVQFCIPPLKTPQPLMPYCTWFFPENTSFDCANIIPKVSCFLDNWFSLLHYLFSKMHTILGKLITHIIAVLNLSFAVHNCFDKRGTYCLLQYLNWFYNYYTLLSSKWLQ